MPADIRPLLEATYAEPSDREPAAWQELRLELEQEKATLAATAEACTRVLSLPMLSDEEDILTRRKGPPTTPVLLLRSITPASDGSVTVTALDDTRAEISAQAWNRDSARFIHRWLARVPRWLVPTNSPAPEWLTIHAWRRQ